MLANDTDVEGDVLALTGYSQPGNGTLAENEDGTLTYTPAANFNGSDSFDYTIADSNGGTATGTVNITVSPVNDVPAVGDLPNHTVNQDTATGAVAFTISDAETEPGNLTVTATSSNPSLVGDESISLGGSGTDRTVKITPTAGQFGTATITLSVSDRTDTASQTFDLTVNGLPVANDDTLGSVFLSSPLEIAVADLIASDTGADGGALTVQAVSNAMNGTVSLESGVVTLRAQTNFSGTASFDCTLDDGNGGTDTATVTLTVASVVELSEIAALSGIPTGTGGNAYEWRGGRRQCRYGGVGCGRTQQRRFR